MTREERLSGLLLQLADSAAVRSPLVDVETSAVIAEALRCLPFRDREVIKLRYGLGDGYVYTLAECARIFRVTRERIRQLELRGLRKLRKHLDGRALGLD